MKPLTAAAVIATIATLGVLPEPAQAQERRSSGPDLREFPRVHLEPLRTEGNIGPSERHVGPSERTGSEPRDGTDEGPRAGRDGAHRIGIPLDMQRYAPANHPTVLEYRRETQARLNKRASALRNQLRDATLAISDMALPDGGADRTLSQIDEYGEFRLEWAIADDLEKRAAEVTEVLEGVEDAVRPAVEATARIGISTAEGALEGAAVGAMKGLILGGPPGAAAGAKAGAAHGAADALGKAIVEEVKKAIIRADTPAEKSNPPGGDGEARSR